ncbi:MAG TPA: ATP-binding protein [Candidatus Bathyarchaeia archaeon]|nr:ATP-binding protein [Candidatus Bathyarchaeia archaeon]
MISAAAYAGWPPISQAVWGLVGVGVLSNVGLGELTRRGRRVVSRTLIGGVMLADVLLLTSLLVLTGGSSNPFAVVYLVNVTLAAVTMGAGWTWTIVIASTAGYAGLFAWPPLALHPGHEWPSHLAGMWLAFVTTAVLIALFVTGVTRTLARREQEVAALRALAARNERLASLTALAAGAAHELATPLGSIAVAAGELERTAREEKLTSVAGDAELIRSQVVRCRDILDRMSGRASAKWIEDRRPLSIDEIVQLLREELGAAQSARLRVEATHGLPVLARPAALVEALGSLVRNAFEASGPDDSVSLAVTADAERLAFAVRDRGAGMSAEVLARAGEAFFTTKAAASGRGLGLFLARLFAERHGGKLVVESAPGQGTTAVLELPRDAGR